MSIYTITTIRFSDYEDGLPLRCRTVGWYQIDGKAFDVLMNNRGDLNEDGYYPYAVVEEVGEGLYPDVKNTVFFGFNSDLNCWECSSTVPDDIKKVAGDWSHFANIG